MTLIKTLHNYKNNSLCRETHTHITLILENAMELKGAVLIILVWNTMGCGSISSNLYKTRVFIKAEGVDPHQRLDIFQWWKRRPKHLNRSPDSSNKENCNSPQPSICSNPAAEANMYGTNDANRLVIMSYNVLFTWKDNGSKIHKYIWQKNSNLGFHIQIS